MGSNFLYARSQTNDSRLPVFTADWSSIVDIMDDTVVRRIMLLNKILMLVEQNILIHHGRRTSNSPSEVLK